MINQVKKGLEKKKNMQKKENSGKENEERARNNIVVTSLTEIFAAKSQ